MKQYWTRYNKITELPIGTWTTPYKAFLEKLMEDKDSKGKKKKPIVKSYKDSVALIQILNLQ